MRDYQRQFIEFALSINALCFGEFKLKSGRLSPYFFNSGLFNSGGSLAKLGQYYASAIVDSGVEFDVLYGPAYKGIPLASATAVALAEHHHRDLPYAFNRKEAKDHGEGGIIVGAKLEGRVLIIDDVISAGTSIRESFDIIRAAGAEVAGAVVSLDRQERGQGDISAIQEVERDFGIGVNSIVTLAHLVEYLDSLPADSETASTLKQYQSAIETYRSEYGSASG